MTNKYNNSIHIYYKDENNQFIIENDLFTLDIVNLSLLDRNQQQKEYQSMHKLYSYILQMVMEGSICIETKNGKTYTVNSGEFLLLDPKAEHRLVYESSRLSKLTTTFNFYPKNQEELNFYKIAETIALEPSVYTYNNEMEIIAKLIISNCKDKSNEYRNVIMYSMVPFIINAFRVVVGNSHVIPYIENNPIIKQAVAYIKENISASLTVSNVAEHLHMTPKQLSRIFSKVVGTTPGRFIHDYRIEKIRHLLTSKDLSVESISNTMGYSDSAAMIKAFRNKTKRSPKQFKKHIAEKQNVIYDSKPFILNEKQV